jgi:hypothetical protein
VAEHGWVLGAAREGRRHLAMAEKQMRASGTLENRTGLTVIRVVLKQVQVPAPLEHEHFFPVPDGPKSQDATAKQPSPMSGATPQSAGLADCCCLLKNTVSTPHF